MSNEGTTDRRRPGRGRAARIGGRPARAARRTARLEAPLAWLVDPPRRRAGRASRRSATARVEQPLLDRAAERRAVEDALAVVRVPGVRVGVEQHERDGAVHRAWARSSPRAIEWSPPSTTDGPRDDHRLAARRRSAPPSGALPGVMSMSPQSTTEWVAKTSTCVRRYARAAGGSGADGLGPKRAPDAEAGGGVEGHARHARRPRRRKSVDAGQRANVRTPVYRGA